MATEAEARAHRALDLLAGDLPALGLALSGGGDSTALMHLATDWAARRDVRLAAVTLDHGLRPDSAAEAAAVGRAATTLGIPHRTLHWDSSAASGNLAAAARDARLTMIGDWARAEALPAVALGHTRDDVAETLLMRLGRGAGIDGLAAMKSRREAQGMVWLRPLLDLGRQDLRDFLRRRGAEWIDDPTNDDLRLDRARVRAAINAAGLDPARLADSARHLASARAALAQVAATAMASAAMDPDGSLHLPRPAFDTAPREVRRMILSAALSVLAGPGYPPRGDTIRLALDALQAGRGASLGGMLATPRAGLLILTREPAAAARAAPLQYDGIWDGRWRVTGVPPGCHVAASAGSAAPALWRGATCLGPLPLAGTHAAPLRNLNDFRQILSM
ncbi:tRNA lysidine(34) synthetase TilS [Paracoccus suum]|uniref:tRNA(Ile)-lysidine synthase n=1 Tax=Paracoccus suum TaxID=2259340 RepID=A0A344PIC7_9RHOB|nr:tRNA lysidine(34) synthetase TilS [Paracoccus suum]AXC49132.1 tRNA lysidine(34) synthetase TilS [Paracoccus suum]